MFQRILKSSLIIPAIAIAFFGLPNKTKAADTSLVLNASDKKYEISKETESVWRQPKGGEVVLILSPETNLDNFLRYELGTKKKIGSNLNFQNYNIPEIYSYLKGVESEINQETKDAKLKIENNRAVEFEPGQNGRTLDTKNAIGAIVDALSFNKTEITLPVTETVPTKSLAETNDLGIKELVGFGTSNFAGSPANRIHNIKVGVSKETGVIIAPGEEFSFNKYLGEVDGEHGFLPELVIKRTGTVPEFGGGLCQVSSTVFRAAMKTGMQITARRNHSYAVSYYAPQGTDATIYPGVQDMKFINNTKAHILVWPTIEKNILTFSFYGTKDSRIVKLDDPYTYDRQANGAMKASWSREVALPDGTILKDTFKSVYQPPALFHTAPSFPKNETPPATTPPTTPTTPPATEPTTPPTTEAPPANNT